MLTSTSDVFTPAELSIARRRLDAPALGDAEVRALAHRLAAQLDAGDADRVVGAVARLVVALGR
jgi:hypothetical protein